MVAIWSVVVVAVGAGEGTPSRAQVIWPGRFAINSQVLNLPSKCLGTFGFFLIKWGKWFSTCAVGKRKKEKRKRRRKEMRERG